MKAWAASASAIDIDVAHVLIMTHPTLPEPVHQSGSEPSSTAKTTASGRFNHWDKEDEEI